MIIRSLQNITAFKAGDASLLRELLHPGKEPLRIGYSLAHAAVEPGTQTLPHRLKSAEVYYIIEGNGLMHAGEEQARVGAGTAVYIPPGAVQFIENTGTGEVKQVAATVDLPMTGTKQSFIGKIKPGNDAPAVFMLDGGKDGHRLGVVELRLLFKESNAETGGGDRLSVKFFIDTGYDAQQRALSGSVQADDTDFGSVKIGEGDILQNGSFIVKLRDPEHRINDFL